METWVKRGLVVLLAIAYPFRIELRFYFVHPCGQIVTHLNHPPVN